MSHVGTFPQPFVMSHNRHCHGSFDWNLNKAFLTGIYIPKDIVISKESPANFFVWRRRDHYYCKLSQDTGISFTDYSKNHTPHKTMKVATVLLLLGAFFLAHVATEDLSCEEAEASKEELWPANGQYVNITIKELSSNSAVVITAVKQDEDPGTTSTIRGTVARLVGNGKGFLKNLFKRGNSNTATKAAAAPTGGPDAVIDGNVTMLKSERLADGDGRIYYIFFNATNSYGKTCSGNVTVCVPLNGTDTNGNGTDTSGNETDTNDHGNCVDSSKNGTTLYTST
jgi:hypothetical protein